MTKDIEIEAIKLKLDITETCAGLFIKSNKGHWYIEYAGTGAYLWHENELLLLYSHQSFVGSYHFQAKHNSVLDCLYHISAHDAVRHTPNENY